MTRLTQELCMATPHVLCMLDIRFALRHAQSGEWFILYDWEIAQHVVLGRAVVAMVTYMYVHFCKKFTYSSSQCLG